MVLFPPTNLRKRTTYNVWYSKLKRKTKIKMSSKTISDIEIKGLLTVYIFLSIFNFHARMNDVLISKS